MAAKLVIPEFQSPDGDFVYSDAGSTLSQTTMRLLFQSPDGDFVYSDPTEVVILVATAVRFNPLTGISSILTRIEKQELRDVMRVSIP